MRAEQEVKLGSNHASLGMSLSERHYEQDKSMVGHAQVFPAHVPNECRSSWMCVLDIRDIVDISVEHYPAVVDNVCHGSCDRVVITLVVQKQSGIGASR